MTSLIRLTKILFRQKIKGGRACAFFQLNYSEICNDILKCLSEDIKIKSANVYKIVEKYLKHEDYHGKKFERKYL